jgi:hypothetical protein
LHNPNIERCKKMKFYTILIFNNSGSNKPFFIYQEPALYSVSSSLLQSVQSSSLDTKELSSGLGASIAFTVDTQVYAGVQEPDRLSRTPGRLSAAPALLTDLQSFAVQPIQVTASGTTAANATNMIINPLGLSPPTHSDNVPDGCFRIAIPSYMPCESSYNAGCAVIDKKGAVILSSFVKAPPALPLDCKPVAIFYVAVGNYFAGTIVKVANVDGPTAKCDFTKGATTIVATFEPNGSWSVN